MIPMKMMKKMTAAALAAAVVLAMAGCGGGDKEPAKASGSDQAVTLKLATALPTSHPLVQAMEQLKTKAAENRAAPSPSIFTPPASFSMTRT